MPEPSNGYSSCSAVLFAQGAVVGWRQPDRTKRRTQRRWSTAAYGIEFGAPPLNPRILPARSAIRDQAGGEMEHRCPKCASLQLTRVREGAFALEWRCGRCEHVFADPLLSVVFVDDNDGRREQLVTCLEREGIPVVAASCVAELEGWPVDKVLVTHAGSVTPLWFDMGAAHVVVLADSDEERALAARMNDERATVASGDPAALLASLRTIAKSTAPGRRGRPQPERRSGPSERRRPPRYDRRS
jgi:CheY-like chemotaxis protein